jgi:transposase
VPDTPFFPSSPSLQLEQVVIEPQAVIFVLRSFAATTACPDCGQASGRVHSRYRRHLTDLPAQGRVFRVQLLARRFFCPAADCPRRIFTERLPDVVAVQGRTTTRLHDAHCEIGFALGGEAGARLAARLAMPTSPDTLLRRVRNAPLPQRPVVRVLGVDDWAFRRGHRYGTILCDLERRRPVDLLPERSAEALCAWLREHPEVEIISRDRGDDYIRGATAGAPQAVQVADRWHLLRNLRDALKGTVDRHHADVRAAAQEAVPVQGVVPPTKASAVADHPPAPTAPPPSARTERQLVCRQRREQLYEQVLVLHGQGLSRRAIADRLGIYRSTVKRFVEAGTFPERASRRYVRRTDRFAEHLNQRWAEGCRNAAVLFEELKARGFSGSYYSVRRQLAAWRKADPGSEEGCGPVTVAAARIERPSARRVSWLMLKDESDLETEEQAFLDRLRARCPELRAAGDLARGFAEMVQRRQEGSWDDWLAQATANDAAKELRSFAESLQKDEAAVRAALRLEWSNGQVEGQVNRLKLIKRQMFGRAKFDLLRQRVLKTG